MIVVLCLTQKIIGVLAVFFIILLIYSGSTRPPPLMSI